MKLTLIRHTSVDVPKGICYGSSDVPLAPTFRNEMEQIRKKLGMGTFDATFSSPLSRCTILASAIISEENIRIDHRLTELNFGNWEMLQWESFYESDEGKIWYSDYVNNRCPNGESFADLLGRTDLFLADLQKTNFKRVLVVTHAGVIRAMMCLLEHKTPEEAFQTPLEYGQIVNFNFEK
ncbi:MAG: alpha-ribazole phosphatase [Bacteroidota bacterium]|nr:alpha-ribazole phosphatase [Bacteroidota bacterium]